MMRKRVFQALLAISVLLVAAAAQAATSVSWTSPADGSTYSAGTIVNPTGNASGTGVIGGTGLDLALVLDSSGSMRTFESGKTRQQWQKDAAHALVDALPVGTTSVTVVQFDSSSSTYQVLTALSTNISAVHTAINNVDAWGGTNIGSGISQAASELTGANHTAGRAQMMVVMSDGFTTGDPEVNAAAAMAVGVDAIHTVGLPGHSVFTMQDIVDGPDNVVGNGDDYGVYTDASNISTLVSIFDGTGGNLVGLDHVDIELPDGTMINDIATDGLGNFVLPDWAIALGVNTFTAHAYGTDGTSASAVLNLNGTGVAPVPEPATMLLFGTGLAGLIGYRKKSKK